MEGLRFAFGLGRNIMSSNSHVDSNSRWRIWKVFTVIWKSHVQFVGSFPFHLGIVPSTAASSLPTVRATPACDSPHLHSASPCICNRSGVSDSNHHNGDHTININYQTRAPAYCHQPFIPGHFHCMQPAVQVLREKTKAIRVLDPHSQDGLKC